MVSIPRVPTPLSPHDANAAGARALPDDPPPTPPSLPLPTSTSTHPPPTELPPTQQNPHLAINGTVATGASAQNGTHAPHYAENIGMEHANGHAEGANELSQSGINESRGAQSEDSDSEAPEVESSTAAAEAASAQLTRERNVRNAARERRRAQRRAAAERAQQAAEERKGAEVQAKYDASPIEAEQEVKQEEGKTDNVNVPLLLPEEVLQAAEDAVGKSRRAEKERRKKERLKHQKGKIAKPSSSKLVGGVEVQMVSKSRKRIPSKGKGSRNTAASFLRHCINKAGGVRVSAATAARIASSAKIRNT